MPGLPFFYILDDAVYEVNLREPPGGASGEVPEALVHDLWADQQFAWTELRTTGGERVEVLHPGERNAHAGPDFHAARLRIGGRVWHGDVEIHTTSGAWFEHGHQHDARYNAVVLHVALHADVWTGGLLRADGTAIPEAVLYPLLRRPLRELLHAHYTAADREALACAARWEELPTSAHRALFTQRAEERLQRRLAAIAEAAAHHDDGLEGVLVERLFAGLGYAPNAEPMRDLAARLPARLLRQHDDPRDHEALLLGTAGLLPGASDLLEADRATADYAMELRARFFRINSAYHLPTLPRTTWQFFRLRPNNFPPLRLAQAAAWFAPNGLLRHHPLTHLAGALLDEHALPELRRALRAEPSPFWTTHVRLEKACKPHAAALGRSRMDALLVNAVLPALLVLADERGDAALETAAREVLTQLRPARDRVTRRFKALGTRARSAWEAQGQHELYREHCQQGRCLRCPVGQRLIAG